jgi:hypothetical protein
MLRSFCSVYSDGSIAQFECVFRNSSAQSAVHTFTTVFVSTQDSTRSGTGSDTEDECSDEYDEDDGELYVGDSWVRWDDDQDWALRDKDCERCGHCADNVEC